MKAHQVLAVALAVLVSAPVVAQTQNPPGERAAAKEQRADRAKERLSADQHRRVPDCARDLLGSLSDRTRPEVSEKPRYRKSRSTDPGKFDAKTGEHLGPADAAFPFDTVSDRPVAINPRRTVEIDTMLDPAEIVVDNDQRSAQRRQLAGIARLDTFKPPALAGVAHGAQLATHRISVAVWDWG